MRLNSLISRLGGRLRSFLTSELEAENYSSRLLQGSLASWSVRRMDYIRSIQDVEFKVFSQFGQDGIIDWLIERAEVPRHLHTFVEFGVETYTEANTRFLLENRNWRGLVIDGNPSLREQLKKSPLFWQHDLTANSAFITRENINALLVDGGFSGDIGILCIDLDGNDYWIWQAIDAVRPIICICEYNAIFGDLHQLSVPYDPTFARTQIHSSNLYFGASLAALCSLAAQKGYRFIGTTSAGNDAFFLREDYSSFLDGVLQTVVSSPSRTRESRDEAGDLSFLRGNQRFNAISHLPIIRTDTGETVVLKELGEVYSADWISTMGE